MVINQDALRGMSPGDMEASIRGVAAAPEPGTARPATMREIMAKLDEEFSVPDVAELVNGHGYTFIWDTVTFERSYCSNNLLIGNLTLTRDDGSHFYTTRQPKDGEGNLRWPWRGTMKCLLHPEHPNAESYRGLGMPECMKSNIPSEYMVRLHVEHKHSDAWAIIKTERDEVIRLEDRAEMRAMRQEMMRRNGDEPVPVTEPGPTDSPPIEATISWDGGATTEPVKIEATTNTAIMDKDTQVTEDGKAQKSWTETCDVCGFVSEPAKGRLGANSRMRSHKNKEHGGG